MPAFEPNASVTEKARRLKGAITIFCVELVAVALLWTGIGVTLTLGLAIGGGIVVLAWPWLVKTAARFAVWLRSITAAVGSRILDRRSYRFGIRSLLLAVLLIAIVLAWLGYQERQIVVERRRLDGRWQIVSAGGKPLIAPDGKPLIVELSRESYTVNPLQEPKWLDFHGPQGTSEAIYRWEGDEIVVMEVSGGFEHPNSFDLKSSKLKPTSVATVSGGAMEVSTSRYRLRRVRDD